MKRREFLASATAAASLSTLFPAAAAEDTGGSAGGREFYELRFYQLRRGAKQQVFEEYVSKAALPALNRIGIGPVGVFNVMLGPESPGVYALIPYKSIDQFAGATDRMRSDPEYQKLGSAFIDAPASDPAYVRVESTLMVAFAGMPRLAVPEKKSRLFELRTYESHSKKANQKKIEMFNVGEIAIFRRAGLRPVFFGETLIGTRMPNLTYMLVYDDLPARDKAWGAFGGDPEWRKLSTTPGYTDPEIVSNISNILLRPAACSQI